MSTEVATPLRIEIIDPLTEGAAPRAGESVDVTVEAIPISVYGAELAAAARDWTAEKSTPLVRAGSAVQQRGNRLAHVLGRRRDQVMFDGNPRRGSRVKQHLFLPFPVVRSQLPGAGTQLQALAGRVTTTTDFERRPNGGVRAAGSMRLPWSWPAIPVWITVDPWWRNQTVATIELRNRRRWRYPRRYFSAAHSAVRDLRAEIQAPH